MSRTDALPYSSSQCQPHLAKGRILKMLEKFGVDQVNLMESFKALEIRISFVYEDIPVSIPVNYRKLGELYAGGVKWEKLTEKSQKQAKNAAWSAIEDYLKSMLVMHRLGIMSIQEIFLPNLVGAGGFRVAELLTDRLPDFLDGKLLTE